MNVDRRTAVTALAAAGLLWGTTVPLTKLALEWLPPAWLTVARLGLAATVLLAFVRSRVRAACSPAVLAWGAVGYGGSILVQNAGITRTSVTHAALLVGATPVLVAVVAAVRHRRLARPVAWTGLAVSFAGVAFVAAGGGAGATATGDGLVLASVMVSAWFTVAQARLLPGRDPVAVTTVQFLAAAVAALPAAAVTEGMPAPVGGAGSLLATAGLALLGTLAAATLFAYGQARASAEVAGAFLNLEPLVGAAAGAVIFGDPVGMAHAAGGVAILTGIALSSLPLPSRGAVGLRLRQRSRPARRGGLGAAGEPQRGWASRSVGRGDGGTVRSSIRSVRLLVGCGEVAGPPTGGCVGTVRSSSPRRPTRPEWASSSCSRAFSCSSSSTRLSASRRAERSSRRRLRLDLDEPKARNRNRASRNPSPANTTRSWPSLSWSKDRLNSVTVLAVVFSSTTSPITTPTNTASSRNNTAIGCLLETAALA
jgi:O-acetylserine/cysteine efflux transporter